ncbi:hypothetical protein BGZ94_003066, partial [Podila epigama]
MSPSGTSVSSPRGEEWEIIDNGPRKSIDELWDEVFEYHQRIKQLQQHTSSSYNQDQPSPHIEPMSEYGTCPDNSHSDRVGRIYRDDLHYQDYGGEATEYGNGLHPLSPPIFTTAGMSIPTGVLTQTQCVTIHASRK